MIFPQTALLALPLAQQSFNAFDNSRYDNLVNYWGQNSYGASHGNDPANWQKPIDFYCENTDVDVYPVGFLHTAVSTGGLPMINLANSCPGPYFPGTSLLNCQFMSSQIKSCQDKGKIITLSIGGATALIQFANDDAAIQFADTIWNLFLGGSSSTRPFGDAVLDGVDLDIEYPDPNNVRWGVFVNRLRDHFKSSSKQYYVTAAPQCPFPDQSLGNGLNSAVFDAIYVQFYNNFCGIDTVNTTNFNFGTWDFWARRQSKSPDTKIFLGVPGSNTAAGRGYLPVEEVNRIATDLRSKFPSFGGVMIWDVSQSVANSRFEDTVKAALVKAGGTGFTFPPCTAPQFVNGNAYTAGQQVTYDGYIWQARWWTNTVPSSDIADTGTWVVVSACQSGSKVHAQSDSRIAESCTMETGEKVEYDGQSWSITSWVSSSWAGRVVEKNTIGRLSRLFGRLSA